MTHELTTSDTTLDTNVPQRLDQLEQENRNIRAENLQFHVQFQTAQRRLRIMTGLAFIALVSAVVVAPGSHSAIAQGYGVTLQQLATRLTAVENKTQFMSASTAAKTTTFSGCNVYVQNGLGATNGNPNDPLNPNAAVVNGLGNLIIGYNPPGQFTTNPNMPQPMPSDVRTGSHNLVLGDANNYSSFGGIAGGTFNAISGAYASVTGGIGNIAGGTYSAVSGGTDNFATGNYSSVSGGAANLARGSISSVSGGTSNFATATYSSVSGGFLNTQPNQTGWSAGSFHTP